MAQTGARQLRHKCIASAWGCSRHLVPGGAVGNGEEALPVITARAARFWSLGDIDPSDMQVGQLAVPFGRRNAQVWHILLPQRMHVMAAGTVG